MEFLYFSRFSKFIFAPNTKLTVICCFCLQSIHFSLLYQIYIYTHIHVRMHLKTIHGIITISVKDKISLAAFAPQFASTKAYVQHHKQTFASAINHKCLRAASVLQTLRLRTLQQPQRRTMPRQRR